MVLLPPHVHLQNDVGAVASVSYGLSTAEGMRGVFTCCQTARQHHEEGQDSQQPRAALLHVGRVDGGRAVASAQSKTPSDDVQVGPRQI